MEFQFPKRGPPSRGLGNKQSLPSIAKKPSYRKLKRVRSRSSKLDLLDNKLTSFPRLSQTSCTISEAESIRIVEDYIPPKKQKEPTPPPHTPSLKTKRDCRTCCNCSRTLVIDRVAHGYDTFLCKRCAHNTPIAASTVVKIDGAFETYYVLVQNQWYTTLRHKLRWRWRIRGLIG